MTTFEDMEVTIERLKFIHNGLIDSCAALKRELKDCRNELCERCGNYREKHLGACDGCRWRADNG